MCGAGAALLLAAALGAAALAVPTDAMAQVTVTVTGGGAVSEGGTSTFTVTLSGTPGQRVEVDYEAYIASGDTGEPADFTATSGTLVFEAGASGAGLTQTFSVPIVDDNVAEGTDSFSVRLSEGAGFQAGVIELDPAQSEATAEIGASDPSTISVAGLHPFMPSTTTEDTSIPPGHGVEGKTLRFGVRLSNPHEERVVLRRGFDMTSGSNAAVAADFNANIFCCTNSFVFLPGTTFHFFSTILIRDDSDAEGPETIIFKVIPSSTPLPASIGFEGGGDEATTTGTIIASDVPEISVAPAAADEGGAVTFTVTLSETLGAAVEVGYATSVGSDDTASQDDFTATSGTLNFAMDATGEDLTQTFMVPTADDSLIEGAETFTVTLTEGTGFPADGSVYLGIRTATGTINASDAATLDLSPSPAGDLAEGGTRTFTATLTGGGTLPDDLSIPWSVPASGDTAAAADFTASSGMVTIAAGMTSGTFTVEAADDDLPEDDETFTVTLNAPPASAIVLPPGVTPGTGGAAGTIPANDTIQVSIEDSSANEGEDITFTVALSGSPPADVVVGYATSVETGDTAVQADFTDTSDTLTFAAGTTTLTQTFAVATVDDAGGEGAETFTVTLTEGGASGFPAGVMLEASTAQGTINASDVTTVSIAGGSANEGDGITFTVTLSRSPPADVVVSYATSVETGDTALQADFTGTSGMFTVTGGATGAALMRTITVPTANDGLAESAETFTMTLTEGGAAGFPPGVLLDTATAKGTINASDATTVSIAAGSGIEGGDVTFTVTLSQSPASAVMVSYATSVESGDTASPADFTATSDTLTFAAGATGADLAQTFAVATVDDDLAEGSETFTVTLTAAGASGFPVGVMLGMATAKGTIDASDEAMVSIAAGSGNEGEDITFTVTLSQSPGSAVMVDYATSVERGDTAEQADFTATSDTLTFAAGATGADLAQTFTVATEDDDLAEDSETFTVTLTAGGASGFPDGVTLGAATVKGTIEDNDEEPGSSPESRLSRVNEEVLPRVVQAMATSTLSAIAGRMEAAASGVPASRLSGLPGKSSLLQALTSSEQALEDGTMDLEEAVGRSSFMLSLNAAGSDDGGVGGFAVWGSGDYRSLSGPDDSTVEWDGDMFAFHLGADTRLAPNLLAGVSVSRSSGSFDYVDKTDPDAVKGDYDSRMTSINPYVSWSASDDLGLWAAVGYGQGEIEIEEEGLPGQQGDIEMKSAAAGMNRKLLSDGGLIPGGTAALKLKGEAATAHVDVEDSGLISADSFNANRIRLAVEGSYDCRPGSPGECLAPSLELGVRHDSGDAAEALGLEVGGALRYTNPAAGLTVEGRGRMLAVDEDGREDWGVGGLVRFDPGAHGRGLSFSLTPAFGDSASNVDLLYNRNAFDTEAGDAEPAARLDTEIGYGFAGLNGVVTPYAGVSLAGGGSRSYRIGGRFALGASLSLSLEGARRERDAAESDHSVMMRGRLHW